MQTLHRVAGHPGPTPLTRRGFFSRIADGVHGAALASLLGNDLVSASPTPHRTGRGQTCRTRAPHFEPGAKSVIHFVHERPGQVRWTCLILSLHSASMKESRRLAISSTRSSSPTRSVAFCPLRSSSSLTAGGGMEVSELLPHFTEIVDDVTLIRSTWGESFNHEPSLYLMHSGRILPGCPSLGSWVVYGLGSENQNLPGYVVLDDPKKLPVNGIQNWQSGWLPPVFQGTRVRSEGPPVLNLHPSEELSSPLVEAERDLLRGLNSAHLDQRPWQPELQARISSYELAARMQLAAPEALDLSQETEQDQRDVWSPSKGDRFLRHTLPDGSTARRAGSALRSDLHRVPDLGCSFRPGEEPAV